MVPFIWLTLALKTFSQLCSGARVCSQPTAALFPRPGKAPQICASPPQGLKGRFLHADCLPQLHPLKEGRGLLEGLW